MNLIDILVAVGVILAGLLGYRDGLFRKIFGIVSFLVGLVLATTYMGGLGRRFSLWTGLSMDITSIVAFFLLFVLIIVLQNVVYRLVVGKGVTIKTPSRIGGAILGIIQGSIAVSLVLLSLRIFDLPSESDKQESALYRSVINVAPRLFDMWLYVNPQSGAFYETLKKDLEKVDFFE